MKADLIVVMLGVFIFALGVVGLARTSSFTPLFISGSVGTVTIWLGWLLRRGFRSARSVTLGWLGLVSVMSGLATFGLISAHAAPTVWSVVIFGSMTAFSLAVLIVVLRTHPNDFINQQTNRRRQKIRGAA